MAQQAYPALVFASEVDRRNLSRAQAQGRLVRVASGIYSGDIGSTAESLSRRYPAQSSSIGRLVTAGWAGTAPCMSLPIAAGLSFFLVSPSLPAGARQRCRATCPCPTGSTWRARLAACWRI